MGDELQTAMVTASFEGQISHWCCVAGAWQACKATEWCSCTANHTQTQSPGSIHFMTHDHCWWTLCADILCETVMSGQTCFSSAAESKEGTKEYRHAPQTARSKMHSTTAAWVGLQEVQCTLNEPDQHCTVHVQHG